MVKTVTLTVGTPQAVAFSEAYPFYWIDNKTSGEVYASVGGSPEPGKDGTYAIAAGSQLRISGGDFNGGIVLLGEGKVQVVASGIAACPFKSAPVSGGGKAIKSCAAVDIITNAVDYPIIGLNLYGKSTQDGTPTPEAPVDIVSTGDIGSLEITACGKNLISPTFNTETTGGVTFTNNGDGTVTLNGTTSEKYVASKRVVSTYALKRYKGKKLKFLGCPPGSSKSCWLSINGVVNSNYSAFERGVTLEVIKQGAVTITIFVNNGNTTVENIIVKPMVTTDLNAGYDDFEPYKGATANITSALPLCSVENVCDELIYNGITAKIIKRTGKIDSYNGEEITTPYISTTGELTAGATIIYQLAEPQEIELTAAEISALRQLQTFEGYTNISNDGGAEMNIEYCTNKSLSGCVTPIIKGLQKQIDDLNAAILSMGGNV